MPTAIKKTKAEDYLSELASECKKDWLENLIKEVITIQNLPSEEFFDAIYQNLLFSHKLTDKKIPIPQKTTPSTSPKSTQSGDDFSLKNLTHEEGVNRIMKDAPLSFHKNLTVIYGRNGSGKSGFTRILKRVANSRTQEDIWQDVNTGKSKNKCKAKITYSTKGKDVTYQWNGEIKVSPFDRMSIFDGKCIPIYLKQGLNFAYQPYGFELFPILSASLQRMHKELVDDIQRAENAKPDIDGVFDYGTPIARFIQGINGQTKPDELNQFPKWDKKTETALGGKNKEKRQLHSLDNQLEVLRTRFRAVTSLERTLIKIEEELSSNNIKMYLALIAKYKKAKSKSVAKKGKTLEDYDIFEQDSEEWNSFIQSAEDYISLLEDDEYPKEDSHCIYCQQKLSKSSRDLIMLYRELFQEEETSELDTLEEKIEGLTETLENKAFAETFPYEDEDFKKVLTKKVVDNAFSILDEADTLCGEIADCLAEKKVKKFEIPKTKTVLSAVSKAKDKIEKEIQVTTEAQRNFSIKSREIEKQISELEDIKKLAKYRPRIEKNIEITNWVSRAQGLLKTSELSTRPITEAGKKAWDELVSDSFKKKFKEEAEALSAPVVNLEFRGEYGSQVREKNVAGMSQIEEILSEGEQKAVALADFFTELSMEHQKIPAIFDDPATSFDHDRKEIIAERIVKESENRQVIVFTHDLMFAGYLYSRVLKPKDPDIDPAKAEFHSLDSHSGKSGIVTANYYHGSKKFTFLVDKVKAKIPALKLLAGEDLNEGLKHSYSILRSAVEKVVEERIFGGVILRWTERIQLLSIPKATLNKDKLVKAEKLHGKFSAYSDAHYQSDSMIQHSTPTLATLEADILEVEDIATP